MRPDFTLQELRRDLDRLWRYAGRTRSLIALPIALSTTLLAFGFAYVIRFRAGRFGNALLFLTLITLFGGYLVKIYAWKSILGRDGILNLALIGLGLIDEPLDAFIYSANGIVITLTYFLLPFAVLPIYGSMRAIRDVTLEASRDLGAGAVADDAQHRPAAMRARHRRRLHVHLPDLGRRLCDAALRRRRRGDDGPFHRDAVLLRLQLADGQRHGLHHHGRVAR